MRFTDRESGARYRLAFVVGMGSGPEHIHACPRPVIAPVRQYRRKNGEWGRLEPLKTDAEVFCEDARARRLAEQLLLLGRETPVLAHSEELLQLDVPLFVGRLDRLNGCHERPLTVIEPHAVHAEVIPQTMRPGRWRRFRAAEGSVDDPFLVLHLQVEHESHRTHIVAEGEVGADLGASRSALFFESGVLLLGGHSPLIPELVSALYSFGGITAEDISGLLRLAETAPDAFSLRYPRRIRIVPTERTAGFVLVRDGRAPSLLLRQYEPDDTDGYDGEEYRLSEPRDEPPEAAIGAATALLEAAPRFSRWEEMWVWDIEGPAATERGIEAALSLADKGYRVYVSDPDGGTRRIRRGGPLSVHVSSGTDWFDLEVRTEDGQAVDYAKLARMVRRGGYSDGESLVLLDPTEVERLRRLLEVAGGRSNAGAGTDGPNSTAAGAPAGRIPAADIASAGELADLADEIDAGVEAVRSMAREILDGDPEVEAELPAGLTAELRPYQRAGFARLAALSRHALSGCLADDMGLGKTVQALAFMLHLGGEGAGAGGFLVVAPLSTLENWAREARRFAPGLPVRVHHGPERAATAAELVEGPPADGAPTAAAPADGGSADGALVVTSYATAVRDAEILGSVEWGLLCLDEAQFIKNPHAKTTKTLKAFGARRRLCLTGTPVENLTTDLWSIIDFLVPGLLGGLSEFTRRFPKRPSASKDSRRLERLRTIVSPFVLRRTKEAVAPELPPRIETRLTCEMAGTQARFYATLKRYHREEVQRAIASGDIKKIGAAVFTGLLRLRQAALYPIDADPTGEGVPSVKERELLEQLTEVAAEGHKALVFSQFVTALARLEAAARGRGLETLYLDGSTKRREALIETFRSAEGFVGFFISLKAGGTGINLTAADYVYICDPWWNPQVERQAVDRAHRIGRENPVVVTRLVTKDTVEDKVLELQQQKRRLAADLIQENDGGLSLDQAEELLALFE
jgi:superfamily II DNA or RNA helicase